MVSKPTIHIVYLFIFLSLIAESYCVRYTDKISIEYGTLGRTVKPISNSEEGLLEFSKNNSVSLLQMSSKTRVWSTQADEQLSDVSRRMLLDN